MHQDPSGDADAHRRRWQIWIDTGGTFTDCIATDLAGVVHRAKVLSHSALRGRIRRRIDDHRLVIAAKWGTLGELIGGLQFHVLGEQSEGIDVVGYDRDDSRLELAQPVPNSALPGAAFEVRSPDEAPVLAARIVTRTPPGKLFPPLQMRLGSTRGTNALLERRGPPTALFVTRGFGDLLLIGDQQRPDLFALCIDKVPPLYETVVEVNERLAADGSILKPLQFDPIAAEVKALVKQGLRTAAIALLHSYRNPQHERALAQILADLGFTYISCSSDLAPLIKLGPRAETAVVDAYLSPVIEDYLARVRSAFTDSRLHVMTSAGGLVSAEAYHAKDSLLSGPAGGVAGAAAAGKHSGFDRVIGLDIGGTSTDVARFDGDYEYQFEHRVAGVRLVAPALAIETVAAGGGSVCRFKDGQLRVGPRSAGASPGPACYGAGGPFTITDVNLLLGRLDPQRFEIPISIEDAQAAFETVRRTVAERTAPPPPRETLLEGFLAITNERMADAIAEVSVRRGYDPADYALVAFGGAGGQHACAVAEKLGIDVVVMPADASMLSAVGLGHAVVERFAQQQVLRPLDEVHNDLASLIGDLSWQARRAVVSEGVAEQSVVVRRQIVNLRLLGQESSTAVELDEVSEIERAFVEKYRAIYGHAPQGKPIEVESIRVVASSIRDEVDECMPSPTAFEARPASERRAWFDGSWRHVHVYERDELRPGAHLAGPALVFESRSAYVIESGWRCEIDAAAAIIARRSPESAQSSDHRGSAVVCEALFSNRFTSIAKQMGQMLQRTAVSTNVKERLDYSCALLDADGYLVVHAPHMPVHLGALGLCVRALREALPMRDGDVVVTNHPAYGGSHLPDITVVTPVYQSDHRLGYAVSRAHHAELGGIRPGSMPPEARTLAEEAVVIEPQYLLRGGESRFDQIERLLGGSAHPSRTIQDNLADLRAAVAANHRGASRLRSLAGTHGVEVVHEQMMLLKKRAQRMARDALAALPDGRYEAIEHLDDGSPICVSIEINGDQAVIDFDGSAEVHPGNLNATPAIVHSAVIYVLRVLIGEALPLNEGIMQAVTLRIPRGMLNPDFGDDPARAPAVGGGNVETSQRIVGTLFKALRICASSQGTMNNVLFGNDQFSYYETVCGGSGATAERNGADAVHTHMTNTRITDPEIIEHRYPVRLERFAIRRGSGGAGRHHGGDGAVREITFLEPVSLSIVSQHRNEGPFGLEGGAPGMPGRQRVVRADGQIIELGAVDGCEINAGDRLILETPGGGGYGSASGSG